MNAHQGVLVATLGELAAARGFDRGTLRVLRRLLRGAR